MTFGMPQTASAKKGGRGWIAALIVLGLLIGSFVLFAGFYTDWLWFDSVEKTSVYRTSLVTRMALFAVFGLLMGVVIGGNIWIAYRSRPVYRGVTPEQASLERYRQVIEPFRRPAGIIVSIVLGLLAGVSAAAEWGTFLLWRNATEFGVVDPEFGLDVSFYTFTMPFIRFLTGFGFAMLIIAILAVIVVNYVYGGLRLQPAGDRASAAAQIHLSILVALLLLLKAVSYWLDRFDLVTKSSNLVNGFTGLNYTDVHAVLPSLSILTFVAALVAVLFIINVFRRHWAIPAIGLALLVLSSIVVGALYPLFVQQFQVRPSELVKEQPYIQRNIDATRDAYGIANVQVQNYAGSVEPPTKATVEANAGTLDNIRLLDPAVVSPTYNQLQQIRAYYSFTDTLDIDRYTLDGAQRGSVVAAREINLAGIPENQRNWANDHAVYTHGYGFVSAYDNTALTNGQPDFYESNIPPTGLLNVTQPRIYFGEESPLFSIVGGPEGKEPVELDYPDDASPTGQVNNTYDGTGGVPMGNFFGRVLFATKFQDPNILLTDLVNSESRIMWDRNPAQRVEKVAPWLTTDQDPYPVVVDGRIKFIVDAYTTSNQYPYSTRVSLSDALSDSISTRTVPQQLQPRDQVNYIRNSVKAVVDAYDGTVTLYAWDETDPVLATWQKAFPGTVTPKSEMPDAIMQHVRYPEDIFKIQRVALSRYHVTDPATFYNGTDFWIVPFDPTTTTSQVFQPPYYLTLQMPGQPQPAFSLTTTFAPQRRQTLAAFMAVNSAPGPDYGTIRVLQLPSNTSIPGPQQVQNNFESDTEVSSQLSLLRRGGSEVEFGNLLSLPFNDGLLYIEPVYVRATTNGYPLLRKVLAGYGSNVAFEDTLDEALAKVFGTSPSPTPEPTPTPTPEPQPNPSPTEPTPSPTEPQPSPTQGGDPATDLAKAIADAQAAYNAGQQALKSGDFTAYDVAQKQLEEALRRAADAEARLNGGNAQPASWTS